MRSKQNQPEYSRQQAVAILRTCYNNYGSNVRDEVISKSFVEDSLGDLPDHHNSGLFRILDEAIYLYQLVSYFSLAAASLEKSQSSQMILFYQIKKNLMAVRVLSANGLDGPARQNLRTLFEMCHSLCRCLVDPEFMQEFSKQSSLESANKFWHLFISKQKNEKFLTLYNEFSEHKCPLVGGDNFSKAYSVLGVGAHPNYLGWVLDFKSDWEQNSNDDEMFSFYPTQSTEFVLVNACEISLSTLSFTASKIRDISRPLALFEKNPLFKHYDDDLSALDGIGKTAGLITVMLAKWINRQKPNFDPEIHF